MHKPILFTAIACLLALCCCHAQEYALNFDTIKVSPKISSMVVFPAELGDVTCLCLESYDIRQDNNRITIKVKSKNNPAPFCPVFVPEGSGSSARQHTLILAYVPEMDPTEAIHDYSTKAKLANRVEYLEHARKLALSQPKQESAKTAEAAPVLTSAKAAPAPAPAPEPAETRVPTPAEAIAADAVVLPGITNEMIRARLRNRIENFYLACENLANDRQIAYSLNYAMRLFNNNEDKLVEYTNSKGEVKHQKIRTYLNRLTLLPYKKVKMTVSELQYISDIHKGADGKYYGTAQVVQDFKGYIDGDILAYVDKTNKIFNYEIVLIEEEKDGKITHLFEVYLGDIVVHNVK